MNTELLQLVLNKRLCFPILVLEKGDSNLVARQLDIALMSNGFKLSRALLKYIGGVSNQSAFEIASVIIDTCQKMIGAHVKHNTYFKEFPKNVPDTMEFWNELLTEYYEETGCVTTNLLNFRTYGGYLHTYEEMLAAHDSFCPKNAKKILKVINLGGSLESELENIYSYLAGSSVPLNEEDRKVVELLCKNNVVSNKPILIRENQAIINAILISNRRQIKVSSPTDVLRLAVQLSGGDCTLVTSSKIKSLPRYQRRLILAALENCIDDPQSFADEVNARRGQFKRLAEKLHPFEVHGIPKTRLLFHFAQRDEKDKKASKITPISVQVNKLLARKDTISAAELLESKPGVFVRNVDRLLRNVSDKDEFSIVKSSFKKAAKKTSSRVLLSLMEHLNNRNSLKSRIFVNKGGTGFAVPNELEHISHTTIHELSKSIIKIISDRIESPKILYVSPEVNSIALPISDKTKSSGFSILPRGSTFEFSKTEPLVRFFIYWKQKNDRTDYDLSALGLDSNFNAVQQISWTNLRGDLGIHSGDITSAPNGASEFIEINLHKLIPEVKYLIPQVNKFAGNNFNECAECFFGFMERNAYEKGAPYEPTKVKTKFSLHCDKGVALPLAFIRVGDGWQVKWLDIYLNGYFSANRVESNKYSVSLLAKSFIDRRYLTIGEIAKLYAENAKKVVTTIDPSIPITYIGLTRPENIHPDSKVYTLDNLKELIPA